MTDEGIQLRLDRLDRLEALFSGGPDTACRTTWLQEHPDLPPTECVEVRMDDLRTAFDGK